MMVSDESRRDDPLLEFVVVVGDTLVFGNSLGGVSIVVAGDDLWPFILANLASEGGLLSNLRRLVGLAGSNAPSSALSSMSADRTESALDLCRFRGDPLLVSSTRAPFFRREDIVVSADLLRLDVLASDEATDG
ncbi:hypothetical protein FRC20_007234 [Serendipita sp. 405]|nr:hypothetical protein FRC20_007234 [Serendipita sp. 405]